MLLRNEYVKNCAFVNIINNGYMNSVSAEPTWKHVRDNYIEEGILPLTTSMQPLFNEVDNYIRNTTDDNDLIVNLREIWDNDFVRVKDLKLICAGIAYAVGALKRRERELQKARENEMMVRRSQAAGYIGDYGDNVELTIESVKVLATRSYGYGYNSSDSYSYQIIDTEGHVCTASTTKHLKAGMHIRAKVKSMVKYEGMLQCMLERIKIEED